MRHRPLLILPLVLAIAASCGADSTTTTVVDRTTAITTATAEVTGDTGSCGISDEADYVCDVETSDDRASGIAKTDIDCDFTEDGETTVGDCRGPSNLTNDGGAWEGTCEGTTTWSTAEPDHVHSIDCTYIGAGAYAGLRYRMHLEGVDFPWSITGLIESIE